MTGRDGERGTPYCVRGPARARGEAGDRRVSPFQGAGFLRCVHCGRAWPLERPACACGADRLPPLAPGTRLAGGWEVVEELCAGRHEDRYHVRRGARDAIALVVRDPYLHDEASTRGARLRALGSPDLGEVIDQAQAWGRLVRVDGLPPSASVRDLLAEGRLDLPNLQRLAAGLARLVERLHGAELVHGCIDVDAVRVVRRGGSLEAVLAPVPAAAPGASFVDDLRGVGEVIAGLLRAARHVRTAGPHALAWVVEQLRTGAIVDAVDLARRVDEAGA